MILQQAMINYVTWEINNYKNRFFPDCDFICYYGGIDYSSVDHWNQQLMELVNNNKSEVRKLIIFLRTTGGSVETVEKIVDITRRFYREVYFVIPEYAMSAGTIWSMSGNKIYMSYTSSLGPIDPQVLSNDNKWVPALGYLDKANEIINKSKNNEVSQAELMMLNQLDLANLRRYEQAVELSIELLKKWLTKYKFSDWDRTETRKKKVTKAQKEKRAQEIATILSDNKIWHSHGRFISIETIQNVLKLKIDDYTEEKDMLLSTDKLNKVIISHMSTNNMNILIFRSTSTEEDKENV